MKNKKITILFQGVKHIQQQIQKSSYAPQQQLSTTKVTFQFNQNIITATSLQIGRLQSVFPHIKLSQLIDDFEQYMTLPSQILGKRSSKIILSKSSKYCLKIVQQEDINEIQTIFQELLSRFQNDKTNCLVNIYFIFLIDYSISGVKLSDRYVIMPNIRAGFDHCIKAFDIKGHLQARVIDHGDFIDFKFGKDQNFVQCEQLKYIKDKISKQALKPLIDQIQENVQFLSKNQIIDYSLLFSLQKQSQSIENNQLLCPQIKLQNDIILKWVIIDYFQIYNDKKKFQNKFKSMFRKSISSVEPQVYSKRLIDFLKKYLLN